MDEENNLMWEEIKSMSAIIPDTGNFAINDR